MSEHNPDDFRMGVGIGIAVASGLIGSDLGRTMTPVQLARWLETLGPDFSDAIAKRAYEHAMQSTPPTRQQYAAMLRDLVNAFMPGKVQS